MKKHGLPKHLPDLRRIRAVTKESFVNTNKLFILRKMYPNTARRLTNVRGSYNGISFKCLLK